MLGQTGRKRLFALHGWIGSYVGLWLFVVCLSGALATLVHELEWLLQPELRIQPTGAVRWQDTYDALRTAYPDHQILTITQREETALESLAWFAYVTAPGGGLGWVRVDPYAARIVRPFGTLDLSRYVEQLHFYVYRPPAFIGFYVVTALAVPLLGSLISGLAFQKGWWRHLFRLRVGSTRRTSLSSAHRFVGLWVLVFGLIVGVTGVWYLVEQAVVPVEIAYPGNPLVPEAKLAAHGPTPSVLPLDAYVAAATRSFPGLRPSRIDLPAGLDGTVAVMGPAAGRPLVRGRANGVFLDPVDARPVAIRRSEEAGWLSWWVDAADPLHFGYWGGLTSKVLWCVLGLCLPGLVLSGAYLSFRRSGLVAGTYTLRAPRRGIHTRTQIVLALMLIAGGLWSGVSAYQVMSRQPVPPPTVKVGETPVGPWHATLWREETVYVSGRTDYYLRLDAGPHRLANVKRVTLWIGDRMRDTDRGEFSGQRHYMTASVPTPRDVANLTRVTLQVQDWSGAAHTVEVPDAFDQSPRITLMPGEAKQAPPTEARLPQAPVSFFAVIGVFVLTTFGVIAVWLRLLASGG